MRSHSSRSLMFVVLSCFILIAFSSLADGQSTPRPLVICVRPNQLPDLERRLQDVAKRGLRMLSQWDPASSLDLACDYLIQVRLETGKSYLTYPMPCADPANDPCGTYPQSGDVPLLDAESLLSG